MKGGEVYILDFGYVRKVGYSRNTEKRVKVISGRFGFKPDRVFTLFVENPLGVESALKSALVGDIQPTCGFFAETFNTNYDKCISELLRVSKITPNDSMLTRKIPITITISPNVLKSLDERYKGSRSAFIEMAIIDLLNSETF